jgi:hypothetical protein
MPVVGSHVYKERGFVVGFIYDLTKKKRESKREVVGFKGPARHALPNLFYTLPWIGTQLVIMGGRLFTRHRS